MLDRGLGAAGVAITPAPVKGVLRLPLATLRSSFPVLRNPANRNRAVPLTPKQFHTAIANTLTEEESAAVYERYHVPGSGRVLFQAATANLNPRAPTRVDFHKDDRDPCIARQGGRQVSQQVEGGDRLRGVSRPLALILGQDGWEEVADYALGWATSHAAPPNQPGESR